MKRNLIVQAFPGQPQMQAAVEALFNDAETTLSNLTAAVEAISALSGDADGIVAALAKKQAKNDTLDAISLVAPDPGVLEQIQAGIFSIRAIDAADTKSLVTRELGDSRWLGQNHQAASSGKWAVPRNLTGSGDVSWSLTGVDGTANVNATTTLATVNANVGPFGSATQVATFTANAKGLMTAAGNVTVTPAVGSITGLGTGVTTALAVNVGAAGSFVAFNGALGTPSSGTLTNCTFPTLNQNTTGSAAKWTTARNLAGNSVDGSANVPFANKFIVQGTTDTGLSGAQFLGALGTGILKNTTTTGVLSIAVAADFPTLNQSTTGSAATLTTSRNIDGQAFNGSADITVIAPGTHAATSKATPVDADELPLADSAATFGLKKLTWANLKATLKTYLDTLYLGISATAAAATKLATARTIAGNSFDGTANITIADTDLTGAAWAAFTPTWTNLSVGNGTVGAAYKQVGKTVLVRIALTFGSTTAVTGLIEFNHPVTRATYGGSLDTPKGFARCWDNSAGASVEGTISGLSNASNVAAVGYYAVVGATVAFTPTSATAPFTWAISDQLLIQYFYEAA